MLPKHERVREFLRRLAAAPPAATEEAALELIATLMNAVEDELSGEPYNDVDASTMRAAARMYPPLADSRRSTMLSGVSQYGTRRHQVLIASNGAIEIRNDDGTVELSKAGTDGVEVSS
jgi:hypothetical protein